MSLLLENQNGQCAEVKRTKNLAVAHVRCSCLPPRTQDVRCAEGSDTGKTPLLSILMLMIALHKHLDVRFPPCNCKPWMGRDLVSRSERAVCGL